MANVTSHSNHKPAGFWTKAIRFLEAMDASPEEEIWSAVRNLYAQNNALKARIEDLEKGRRRAA